MVSSRVQALSHGDFGCKIETGLRYIQYGAPLKIIHEEALLTLITQAEIHSTNILVNLPFHLE